MKLLLVDNANLEDADFNQPLISMLTKTGVNFDIVSHHDLPTYRTIRSRYDAIILSGVPLHYSFQSIDNRAELFSWITTTRLPILGICLGHQVIGELFGGEIVPQLEEEIGQKTTKITKHDAIFREFETSFKSYMFHRAAVTKPQNFDIIASTNACENAVMKHHKRAIYGMQFHPEHSPEGASLLANFIQLAAKTDSLTNILESAVLADDADIYSARFADLAC